MIARFTALLALLACVRPGAAGDFSLHGFADVRLVAAPDETSWTRGGLGKARYGASDAAAQFGAAGLVATWQFAPEWLAHAGVRYQPRDGATVSLTEAFVRYRPVSTSPWRWSIKAGELFVPVSLENDAIGWTSVWTITPSAIDSWVGEELRAFGSEVRLERRGETNSFEAAFALFETNDPAGEILAARGWSLGDVVSGVGSRLREPDVYANLVGVAPPRRYDPFLEIDHRIGAYADLTWRSAQFGRVTLLYYDNDADPSAYHTFNHGDQLFGWRTKFTSLGAQTDRGPLVLIAQAMHGTTEIEPPFFSSETHFSAGYVLAGWNIGNWRPALRYDAFAMRVDPESPAGLSEHGNAVTFALNWRPLDWLRLTGEALRIDSTRDQRIAAGLAPQQKDTQIMFNARIVF